ncbi:MAG: Trk family potassium uptake protein [Clostridiales bacterium]|nr:Trk family potassium uptake protein [Clostridiales bacterium]
MKRYRKLKLTIWQYLSLGYLLVILIGTLFLCLPFSTKAGEDTSFINALFTATSATCVTGLVPYDTNTHWTIFGQTVILLLIQIGGLGFMTFVTLVLRLIRKRIGMQQKKVLMISAGEERPNELKRLFKRLLLGTFIFEALGATLLSIRFIKDFGTGKGIYYSVFHAVSAFCNAGFDLMGGAFGSETFVSLTHYALDPLVSLTIAFLIIIGGLGFCVWDDVISSKGKWKRYNLHTKIVLFCTAILLLVSTILFLFFERNNADYTSYTFGERILVSFFNATTPRTAGFNTVDLTHLSDGSYLLSLMLMFIGGSPASTAGGVKVTTFFVIIVGMIAVFRNKRDIEIGRRRIHGNLLRQSMAIFVSCLFIVLTATLIICCIEENNALATFQAVLFETVSAMGTVGLSLSLTPTLSAVSKIIIILLMYAGRVGILTIALTFSEKKDSAEIKKPIENIFVG